VYDTAQLPADMVQEAELNVPPILSFHETVPVGTLGDFDVSAIFAVNVTCDPWFTQATFGVTVVVVL